MNLTRNHIYSYCFEAPQGAPNEKDENGEIPAKGKDYDNIFNISNFNDPVPLVAMNELGFARRRVGRAVRRKPLCHRVSLRRRRHLSLHHPAGGITDLLVQRTFFGGLGRE